MADQVTVTIDGDNVEVASVAEQGPPGPSGSSVPATTTSLGGVIVGGGLSVITNGNATTNGTLSTNATLIGLGNVDNTPDIAKPISNLTQAALDGKALVNHNHTIANITGLQTALDGKQPTGLYVLTSDSRLSDARVPLSHTHAISDVTGLQAALDGKLSITSANATFQPISGMAVYLTANLAATTYQTIANNTWANLSGAPNISLYAPLANASLTGTPTAPTPANGTNTTQLATTAFVVNALSGFVTLTGTQTLTNKTLFGTSLTGTTSIGGTTDLSGNLLQRAGVLPIVVSSASYTLQQSDCGGLIVLTGTSNQTITIPTGLSRGYNVSLFQKSAFTSTIAAGSGVTIYAKNGAKTSGQNALVGIVDVGDANPPTGFSIGGDTTT